ncbi:MAG: MATE family efflux transporter [Oscillospiraceae bacterium]
MADRKNDFTQGSVSGNIVRLALPLTLAQIINVLYNIVDRIYISRIPGEGILAFTGVGVAFPIITLITAFTNLCGMGGSPLFSIARGRGDDKDAELTMGNSFTMLLIISIVLTAVLMIVKLPVLRLFGASEQTLPYADGYLTIYLCGTVFVMTGLGMNNYINAQGFGRVGMLSVVIGALLNIALDPLFIFAFKMGVRGAAAATVISQFCSCVWVLRFLTGRKAPLILRRKNMRLKWSRVREIVSLGLTPFVMKLTNSAVQVAANATLYRFGGDLYVGVMTAVTSLHEVVHLPILGATNASQPVLGYNFGAKAYSRVRQGIFFVTKLVVAYSAVLCALLMLFPRSFISIFSDNRELLDAAGPAVRIYFAAYFVMSLQFAGQSSFLALGYAKPALFFSILRKGIIVVPLTLVLPNLFGLGVNGVFLAEPISCVIGGLACYLTMLRIVMPRLRE